MPSFLNKKKEFIVLALLIFAQFVLISFQVPQGKESSYFSKAFFSIFSPVQHGISSFFQMIDDLWIEYLDFKNIRFENKKMKKEIFFLRHENLLIRNTLQNLSAQREIQDNLKKIHYKILPARIIGLDATNYFKSMVINKGLIDGLKKNMTVLDKDGNLIGRVIKPISLKEARVQLITDNKLGVSVFSEEKNVVGILTGDAKGLCFLKYILVTNQDITEGGCIFTSGYDGIFPPGINVGEIISISTGGSLFKTIKVKPYFDFRYLDHVAVIMVEPKELF
ncbi:MAG: rod shape-determining protein MreC [Candidatus Aminicenantes bacterium]|nr:rod shape-determining protein MreC [Candidatus Aminicenantes bacterium]